jgi:hypothetical protein
MKWKICTNTYNKGEKYYIILYYRYKLDTKQEDANTHLLFFHAILFVERDRRVVDVMSSLDKMWISFASMGFMMISMGLIYFSRFKLNNKIMKFVFALVAYVLLIIGFIFMIYIVFSGPTSRS